MIVLIVAVDVEDRIVDAGVPEVYRCTDKGGDRVD